MNHIANQGENEESPEELIALVDSPHGASSETNLEASEAKINRICHIDDSECSSEAVKQKKENRAEGGRNSMKEL